MITINNKLFELNAFLSKDSLFICNFSIHDKYRGKKFSYLIFKYLLRKYKVDVTLDCWPTLFDYYTKLGFIKTGESNDGYYEMELKYGKRKEKR